MDEVIVIYFRAWNERDPDERRHLLERAITDDAVLFDSTGRWEGAAGVGERIGRYHSATPGTKVVPASDVDAHNHVVRYAWRIVDRHGSEIIQGTDVAERSDDGRLKRILMFHGPLRPLPHS